MSTPNLKTHADRKIYGENGEKKLAPYLEKIFNTAFKSFNKDWRYDILFKNGLKIECKRDELKAPSTGNVFIEYMKKTRHDDEPTDGGITTTQADYYSIIINPDQFIVVKTADLWRYINNEKPYTAIYTDNVNTQHHGYLVKYKRLIRKYEATRYNF